MPDGERWNPPDDQSYYWTPEWQENERIAVEELARGEGVRFENAADAIRWLKQDDELDEHDRFGDVPDYTPQPGADPDAESSHSGRALESTTKESTP